MPPRDLTCRELTDFIYAYEEGELPEAERAAFEAHLAECPDCVAYLAGYRPTVVNLFMDYETFGEHQWAETGIFEFMRRLPAAILDHADGGFVTPSEALAKHGAAGELSFRDWVSWADSERDLTAWLGNRMQKTALEQLLALRAPVLASGDPKLVESWRRLSTSDHLYYMCTKYFADGDVHKYFSPYESPYEAHIAFLNVLADLAGRLQTQR